MTDSSAAVVGRERAKYERVWVMPEYRRACHGLHLWNTRRDLFPERVYTALDIGCGTGRLLDRWHREGIDGWGVDLASNALDPDIAERLGDRVKLAALWEMSWGGRRFDLGVCADVMEHIPEGYVAPTLAAIGDCCDEVLFKIAHGPANDLGGEPLHMTQRSRHWWAAALSSTGAPRYLGVAVRSGNEDSLFRWIPGEAAMRGKHVLVVGSAPGVLVPEWGDYVIGANAGARIAVDAGRKLDAIATTSYLLRDMDARPSAALSLAAMRGLVAPVLWVDELCGPLGAADLDRRDVRYTSHVRHLRTEARAAIVASATGSALWVSTGVFAACLAVVSGARHVTLTGINPDSGGTRDHVDADRTALAAMNVEVLS